MSPKSKPSYIVRKIELNDCDQVTKIWKSVGFNLSYYQNHIMMNVDPDAIQVAQDIQAGELLGVCSGINHTSDLASIGQFIVKPEYQGLGIGSALWRKVMDHIGTERNISIYAQPYMVSKYRDKWGFKINPDKKLMTYEGKVNCDHLVKNLDGISVVRMSGDNIHSVVEYDKEVCDELERRAFIEYYSKSTQTIALTALNTQSNKVLGYCIITITNFDSTIVYPLYADNELIAELLIGKCCELLPVTKTNGLMFQFWDSNHKSMAIANKIGLKFTHSLPILFTKSLVEGKLEKIFCLGSRSFLSILKISRHKKLNFKQHFHNSCLIT